MNNTRRTRTRLARLVRGWAVALLTGFAATAVAEPPLRLVYANWASSVASAQALRPN